MNVEYTNTKFDMSIAKLLEDPESATKYHAIYKAFQVKNTVEESRAQKDTHHFLIVSNVFFSHITVSNTTFTKITFKWDYKIRH